MSADKYTHPLYIGFAQQVGINLLSEDVPKLIKFAERVAVHATMAERERCAKVCEDETMGADQMALNLAAAIRGRKTA